MRRGNAAHCNGRSRLAAGGDSKTPPTKPRAGQQNDPARPPAAASQPPPDKQANGLTPNGSGGIMTSGQRLLAAQSGASTLDPKRSDD